MSPTIDVDEYVRLNQSPQVQDGPRVSWDSIESNWKDKANNLNVHSLSFGRYSFLRAQGTDAIQISSSMREEHFEHFALAEKGKVWGCAKYVLKPDLVNAVG